ncbi:MAG: CapA family protein [Anaerolineales bacterium]|jgi:poly-gamma-glutamate synthesis protein (capsule biosynthesis protein)
MKINLSAVSIFLVGILLTGCAASNMTVINTADPPVESPTRTPFLPVSDTPISASATPTFTATVTDTTTVTPTGTPTPSLQVKLMAVGDIMLARTVGSQVQARGPGIVFAGVQPMLNPADILVGNLECALTTSTDPQHKSYTFAAPPETAKALALAGFDILSLANNHAMDYGSQGLFDTQDTLSQYGIEGLGAGANTKEAHTPVILQRNGLKLAFLAFADIPNEITGFDAQSWIANATQPGIAWADPEQMKKDVAAARLQADVVVVLLHSGLENSTVISANQRAEAYAAIDGGAALVIGSHSHILQSIEKYHGGLIAFSLGNFVFDDYKGISNATIILQVILTKQGFQSYNYIPVLIENGLPAITKIDNVHGIETLVAP